MSNLKPTIEVIPAKLTYRQTFPKGISTHVNSTSGYVSFHGSIEDVSNYLRSTISRLQEDLLSLEKMS